MDRKTTIRTTLAFLLWIGLQTALCNNVVLFGYALPLLYSYFIIKLPLNMNRSWVITLGFLMGWVLDIFTNTLGMHAFATVTLAFVRPSIIRLAWQRGEDMLPTYPSISSMGFLLFSRYLLLMLLTLTIALFGIESFALFEPLSLLLKIVSSTLLTYLLMIGVEYLTLEKKK